MNGGDIDYMEFKINEATNNPVPTDIFTFKKLANHNARNGHSHNKKALGARSVIGRRRESITPSHKKAQHKKTFTKYKRSTYVRDQINERINKIL